MFGITSLLILWLMFGGNIHGRGGSTRNVSYPWWSSLSNCGCMAMVMLCFGVSPIGWWAWDMIDGGGNVSWWREVVARKDHCCCLVVVLWIYGRWAGRRNRWRSLIFRQWLRWDWGDWTNDCCGCWDGRWQHRTWIVWARWARNWFFDWAWQGCGDFLRLRMFWHGERGWRDWGARNFRGWLWGWEECWCWPTS